MAISITIKFRFVLYYHLAFRTPLKGHSEVKRRVWQAGNCTYKECNIPGYPSSGPRGCQVTTIYL